MKKYLAETIGTFILVFCGTAAIVSNDISGGKVTHVGVSLVFGLVVMAMIHAVGDVSGAHLNPAITLAFAAARRIELPQVLPYIGSQFAGAFAASALLRLLFVHPTLGATLPSGWWCQSFAMEVLMTAILMFVVMSVADGPKEKGLLAAVAIGGVIALEALLAGPISGASMNPARSLAPAVVSGSLQYFWIYLTAPVLGALLGVGAHKAIR